MLYVYYYSDSYEIDIRDYNEEEKEYDTATYYVTEEVYNQCEIESISNMKKVEILTRFHILVKKQILTRKETRKEHK